MFLTEDDYKAVCDEFEFEQLQANTALREQAEAAAREQISSYLRDRYDTGAAFAMEGDARNAILVQVAVNISLYLIVHRLPLYVSEDGGDTDAHNPVRWGSAADRIRVSW